MTLVLLTSGDKVKLRIVQPFIKCSGRENVECFYRGKVIEDLGDEFIVQLKSYGKNVQVKFDRKSGLCKTDGYQNLQIKE